MIVSLGDAVVDLVALELGALPAWGEDREVPRVELQLGGSGVHVATNLAALGNEVALVAGVGEDAWGRFLIERLERSGVSVAGVRRLPVPSAVTMVLSGASDRAFVSAYGATAAFAIEDVERSLLAGARHLHLSGLWQSHALRSELPALLDELRAQGLTLSLDTNYDPTNCWGEPLPALLERVDCFLPSEIEAMRITGAPTPEAALAALAARVPLVAVKLGPLGAIAQRGEARWQAPAFPVEVVDTTGAGDAFDAGFLHGWLAGWPMDETLRFANGTGALAVMRVGASEGAPDEATVRRFMAARGGGT